MPPTSPKMNSKEIRQRAASLHQDAVDPMTDLSREERAEVLAELDAIKAEEDEKPDEPTGGSFGMR